jgi:hypothetical protein
MPHKTSYKYIFLSDFYVNKYGKLRVYGTSFVYTWQLGGIYDSQATNRSAPELGVLAQSPPCLLLVAWESYMYDS